MEEMTGMRGSLAALCGPVKALAVAGESGLGPALRAGRRPRRGGVFGGDFQPTGPGGW